MRCPNCGSNNTVILQEEDKKGYGFCCGIFGYICLGIPGLLCGLLGMGNTNYRIAYIACGDCGTRTRI